MKERFLLRLDGDGYEALERWAADERCSVNGQIEFLLLDALKRTWRSSGRPSEADASTEETSRSQQNMMRKETGTCGG